jgi:hypothetical protein
MPVRLVVEDVVGSQTRNEVALGGAGDSGDLGAQHLGQLHCVAADAAEAPVPTVKTMEPVTNMRRQPNRSAARPDRSTRPANVKT